MCSTPIADLKFFCRPGTKQTKLAVPYRACDVPSDRSEFKHPDIAIILTHLSYYQSGLSMQDLLNALEALLQLPPSQQESIYRSATAVAPAYNMALNLHNCCWK